MSVHGRISDLFGIWRCIWHGRRITLPRCMRWSSLLAVASTCLNCGVSGPNDLPPPPLTNPSYPTFAGPGFSIHAHDAVGLPDCEGTLITRQYFLTCHHDDWLIPSWVGYVLLPEDLDGPAHRDYDFRADPELPVGARAELSDYEEPTFDRGHMAPASDFTRNDQAMSDTFYLSNIAPQYPEMNRGDWKSLEDGVRKRLPWAEAVWIFTGNLVLDGDGKPIDPQVHIGKVVVPSHCFKVALYQYADDTLRVMSFVIPNIENDTMSWPNHKASIDEVEAATGLDLFSELSEDVESEMESVALPLW